MPDTGLTGAPPAPTGTPPGARADPTPGTTAGATGKAGRAGNAGRAGHSGQDVAAEHGPASVRAPEAVRARRYHRTFDRTALVIVVAWHLAGYGPGLLDGLGGLRSPVIAVTAYVTDLAVIITTGALMLRNGGAARAPAARWRWPLLAVLFAAEIAALIACIPLRFEDANWIWGATGWAVTLLLLRRPLPELLAALLGAAALTLVILACDGMLTRHSAAGFCTVLYASASIQIATWVAARSLELPAGQAARAAVERAALTERQAVMDAVHASRAQRGAQLRAATGTLLAGLAEGRLAPARKDVQDRCAVAAARLRQLLAERDAVPDPLVHGLRAAADMAERRGARVELVAIGRLPALPAPVRTQLVGLPLPFIATAPTHVRITVTAESDAVVVSVLTDSPAEVPEDTRTTEGVQVSADRIDELLWLEARWDRK